MRILQPIGDKIVVKAIEASDKTESGIYLPDSAKSKPVTGTVIAVGTGRTLDNGCHLPLTVNVGDLVLFSKYGGSEVTIDGEDYTVMAEDQVYVVIERNA
jgi:chaperonin GroES